MTSPSVFESATPVLRSSDYPRSRDFYTDILGFTVMEEGGDPPRFGIFKHGGAVIFLNAWDTPPAADKSGWDAYLHVTDIETLHRKLSERSDCALDPIRDTVYGMREFDLTDPDGNVLCFGEDPDRA